MFCTNCGNPINSSMTHCPVCQTAVGARATGTVTPAAEKAELQGTGKLVGRTLGGRYQLHSLIGTGGMGEIYRAYRTHIGDTVAVKVLRADVVGNDKSRQRFFREARAAALLHHPNAVVIHDFGEDEGGLAYIVMELLVGRSLRQVLQEEQVLEPVRAYGILRQAAAALEAGHRSGIIHRDIKPDNIVLLDSSDDHDHVKILDFGIAKLRDIPLEGSEFPTPPNADANNLTNAGMVIGTPNYMSPEQCQGEEADARSDIYSLGVVMYEVLTGVMPFTGKTPTSVAIKHVTEAPRPLRSIRTDIPVEIENVILRALSKSPHARQQSMLEMARDYAQALQVSGITSAMQQQTMPGLARPQGPTTAEVLASRPTAVLNTGEDASVSDNFRTSISDTPLSGSIPVVDASTMVDLDSPTLRPKSHKLTDALPALSEMETQLTPKVDEYATMIPEGPDAPARPNPFAQMGEPSSSKETLIDPPAKAAAATVIATGAIAPKAGDSGILVELPSSPETGTLKKKSGSQKVLLIGLVSVLLVGGAWVWSVLTKDNQDKRAQATPTPTPQASPTIAPSATMVPPDGMVLIPGGEIVIGRSDGEENEQPTHKVSIAPFYLDLTEVTVEQYADFLAANLDHLSPLSWKGRIPPPGTEKLPVTDVSWRDASDYAAWKQRRLPTEEEWEFAARGPEGLLYPWGATWQPAHANAADDEKDKRKLDIVGTYLMGKSRFGILDMAGNAWEWTDSDYQGYEGKELKVPEGYLNLKVIRGGSFSCLPKQVTATYRRGWPATVSDWPDGVEPNYAETGFRTAQDVPKR